MKRVYISCPVVIPRDSLLEIVDRVSARQNTVATWWSRQGYYNPDFIKNADAVIIVHPNNQFEFPSSTLPVGVLKELKEAVDLGKKIYLAYKGTTIPGWNLYQTKIDKRPLGTYYVSGIMGSTGSLFESGAFNDTVDFSRAGINQEAQEKLKPQSRKAKSLQDVIDYQNQLGEEAKHNTESKPNRKLLLIKRKPNG